MRVLWGWDSSGPYLHAVFLWLLCLCCHCPTHPSTTLIGIFLLYLWCQFFFVMHCTYAMYNTIAWLVHSSGPVSHSIPLKLNIVCYSTQTLVTTTFVKWSNWLRKFFENLLIFFCARNESLGWHFMQNVCFTLFLVFSGPWLPYGTYWISQIFCAKKKKSPLALKQIKSSLVVLFSFTKESFLPDG